MSQLSCGIVGLPNVGKSTLFNALVKGASAAASNFPFCTIEPNVGIVPLPDTRLEALAKVSSSEKVIPATVRFVDIAGLVKGASEGEGLGNKFLQNIRECDAILHVVRCFESDDIIHVHGKVDPVDDRDVINLELVLADAQMIDNILVKIRKQAKAQKDLQEQVALLEEMSAHLYEGKPLRSFKPSQEKVYEFIVANYSFLSAKPLLYVANIEEAQLGEPSKNPHFQALKEQAEKEGAQVLPLCCALEAQIAQLEGEEQEEMLCVMGLEQPGLHLLIQQSFDLLGLRTYLTTGPMETRAWTIVKGTKAPQAAGKIHGDLEKGFIRAEVISYDDYVTLGKTGAKDAGKVRLEGKEYVVEDGDVILFHHNI